MTQITAGPSPEPLRTAGAHHGAHHGARPSAAFRRLRQFVRGLRAEVPEAEMRRAAALLPHTAFGLFLLLPVDAQRHSLNVLATLESAGPVSADLAAAALLHDVGKLAAAQAHAPITLWLRGPLVLLDAFAPGLIGRLARPDPTQGWRYTLHVHLDHPAIGAAWAEEAGCSPGACWLIAHHQDHAAAGDATLLGELARLQWADGVN